MENIHAICPLDGRYHNKINELDEYVSEYGLIKYRLIVEIEWFKYLFSCKMLDLPILTITEIDFLDNIIKNFDTKECILVKKIENTTNHDVKALEYYIKERLVKHPTLSKYSEFVHFACTSEDINNLSYALMLKDVRDNTLSFQFALIQKALKELIIQYKDVPMISRTHGQVATPTTMGKELFNVLYRLKLQIENLKLIPILGKINGAVGNYNAHVVCYPDVDWINLTKNFVENILQLQFNPITTQIEPHDYMASIFDNVKRINVILLDLVKDIWAYIAINYFKQKVVANEVGSSTMPHKINPIDFENAEGNLGMANALLSHLSEKLPISRWQRDLSDSTVQRNIGIIMGYCVLAYKSILKGLGKLELNFESIKLDLDNNWGLLAEPIQMVMRKCKVANSYEELKQLTRGKVVDKHMIKEFINSLEIDIQEKQKLQNLTPENYIGLASKLINMDILLTI